VRARADCVRAGVPSVDASEIARSFSGAHAVTGSASLAGAAVTRVGADDANAYALARLCAAPFAVVANEASPLRSGHMMAAYRPQNGHMMAVYRL
jgi:hypothetical protein